MKSILIVEDDLGVRLALIRILGRHGWSVDAVDDVESALAFLYKMPSNVVLTDWHLGDDSGLCVLRAIKMHPAWGMVPVLMMSCNAALEDVEQAFGSGANDFLSKPFSGEELMRKLDRWSFDPGDSAKFGQAV
jgi:DNA-binding response OmpR family regulator